VTEPSVHTTTSHARSHQRKSAAAKGVGKKFPGEWGQRKKDRKIARQTEK